METDFIVQNTPVSKTQFGKQVKVFVRIRPLIESEIEEEDCHNILTVEHSENQVTVEDGSKGIFKFDGVFDENSSQSDVFEDTIAPLLPSLKAGHNITVLAYGQTGSGKTYSMGTHATYYEDDEGILQRVIKAILSQRKIRSSTPSSEKKCEDKYLKIAFLEIYNDVIFDLFDSRRIISTKPDGLGGIVPVGFKEEPVASIEETLSLLKRGNELRSVTSTTMNSHSSRSHALILVTLTDEIGSKESGCLRLVDLAGSEGVGRSLMEGKGFCEGVCINKGLLAIGKVLAALSCNNSSSHIPYRDSFITRLLRDSLGGDNFTVMLTCVSPASNSVSVTVNTLRYSEQARNIRKKTLAYSSTKRKGVKRINEDISATPNALKKFLKRKDKPDYNSTISTPGYKPTFERTHRMNSSFTSPFNNHGHQHFELSPLKETMEHSSLVNSSLQVSPFVERMNIRLDQSMALYEEKMEKRIKEMGEEVTQTLLNHLLRGDVKRRQSQRLVSNEVASPRNLPSLPDAFLNALEKRSEILTNALQTVLTDKLSSLNEMISQQPFRDISNLSKQSRPSCTRNMPEPKLPITSTAIVRRSSRLSSKMATRQLEESLESDQFDITCDTTVLERTVLYSGASPVLGCGRERFDGALNVTKDNSIHDKSTVLYPEPSVISQLELSCVNDTEQSTVFDSTISSRRSTSRKCAFQAIQKNHDLLCKRSKNILKQSKNGSLGKDVSFNASKSKYASAISRDLNIKKQAVISKRSMDEYRKNVLRVLNDGSVRELQKLPTVGPKTALIIYNFRHVYGTFDAVEDLRDIPALPNTFYTRFVQANLTELDLSGKK